MDTSKEYIKQCEKAEEIQELRIDKKYPEFPHKAHKKGDYFAYRDYSSLTFTMSGDDQPPEPATGIYIFGSHQVQGADIPKKEQYLDFIGKYTIFKDPLKELIFLPRQDQLQEMVKNIGGDTFGGDFFIFWKFSDLCSWEQLWLAFVMNELYNKKWDGKDWINE